MTNFDKIMRGRHVKKIIGMIVIGTLILFGMSAIVMYLWNFALVPSLNLDSITLWQAMAILVLSKILFTGFRPRHKPTQHAPWQKWRNLSDEDRQVFKDRWKEHCKKRD
jgi:hypothetical protein